MPDYRIYLYDILGKAKLQGQEADPWLLGLQLGERLPTKGMSEPYRGWGLLSTFTMVTVPMSVFRACKTLSLSQCTLCNFCKLYLNDLLHIYVDTYMYANTQTHINTRIFLMNNAHQMIGFGGGWGMDN